jgi:hypothetical protein
MTFVVLDDVLRERAALLVEVFRRERLAEDLGVEGLEFVRARGTAVEKSMSRERLVRPMARKERKLTSG